MHNRKGHILIAGGGGFLGSHVCDHFLKKKFKVICIDNFLTGDKENIRPLLSNRDFYFREADVTQTLVIDEDIDFVLHLASPASPVDYQKFPLETLKVGALGTLRLLELAHSKGARFLLASTSEVYGDPKVHPQGEDYWGNVNPVGPRSCYDESKRYAESLTVCYRRVHGLDTAIARIFNTYGPKMRLEDGRALPNFLTQALKEKEITVYGDGTQTRSFCYVQDMVLGLEKLLFSGENDPVNLGNPEEISLFEFAKLVLRLVKSKSKIVFLPLPKDDPKVRRPDIAKAKRVLGWEPLIPLEEGLLKTLPYFAKKLNLP